jgi:hypothetical protein
VVLDVEIGQLGRFPAPPDAALHEHPARHPHAVDPNARCDGACPHTYCSRSLGVTFRLR